MDRIISIYNGFVFLVIMLLASSCSTPLREITYLNGIKTNVPFENGPKPDMYRMRPNDQLYIQVISDDPQNVAFLNIISGQGVSGGASSQTGMQMVTYLVDENGMIEYPFLGQIKVGGQTISEISANIQEKVDQYLENASVFVKSVNRTITVLGEVRAPGQILMVKNELTIFEALGGAGDITDYGKRKNIKVLREIDNGKLVVDLDLTNPDIIFSPYYYILPHDIIIVEHSTKMYGAKNLPYATPISIATAILSMALLALNLFL